MRNFCHAGILYQLSIRMMLLDLVDYAIEIGVETSLEEGNRVCYDSVVCELAMADGGRFAKAGFMIHGSLRLVAVKN